MTDLLAAAERVTRFHTCTLSCTDVPLHKAIDELRATISEGRPTSVRSTEEDSGKEPSQPNA